MVGAMWTAFRAAGRSSGGGSKSCNTGCNYSGPSTRNDYIPGHIQSLIGNNPTGPVAACFDPRVRPKLCAFLTCFSTLFAFMAATSAYLYPFESLFEPEQIELEGGETINNDPEVHTHDRHRSDLLPAFITITLFLGLCTTVFGLMAAKTCMRIRSLAGIKQHSSQHQTETLRNRCNDELLERMRDQHPYCAMSAMRHFSKQNCQEVASHFKHIKRMVRHSTDVYPNFEDGSYYYIDTSEPMSTIIHNPTPRVNARLSLI